MGLWNIQELSKHLGIKSKTLYAWTRQGKIPFVKIHGLVRFRPDEIETWLESFQKDGEDAKPIAHVINRKGKGQDYIHALITKISKSGYNPGCGETRPKSSPKKEKNNGAV
ncbi:MAG: helix-turn-helix domain-containing protein [Nitrospiria bacterium]